MTKTYSGRDAGERLARELAALQRLHGALPVPVVLDFHLPENVLQTNYLTGRHGQELIDEGHAAEVLYSCGRLLQRLQALPTQLLAEVVPGYGPVIVHGDFGPQNILIAPTGWITTGLLDWEWVHLGDPVEDLAWAEWIVRTHHADAVGAIPELFRGYGSHPPWHKRHMAMLEKARWLLDYAVRNGADGAITLWKQRVEQTERYQE